MLMADMHPDQTPMTDHEYDPMAANKLKVRFNNIPIMDTPRSKSDIPTPHPDSTPGPHPGLIEMDETPLVNDITIPPSPTTTVYGYAGPKRNSGNYLRNHHAHKSTDDGKLGRARGRDRDSVISPSFTGKQNDIALSYGDTDATFGESPSSFGLENKAKQAMISMMNLEDSNLNLIEDIDGTSPSRSNTETLATNTTNYGRSTVSKKKPFHISGKTGTGTGTTGNTVTSNRASDIYRMNDAGMGSMPPSLVAAMHQKPAA